LTVLLASASAGGTIAAVRHLGAAGIDVRVISSERLCAAAWSHFTSRSYATPPECKNRSFLARLLAIGAADPGQILLPTSDQTAWLYAENASLLRQHFCLYQPPITSIRNILDKRLFAEAALSAGLAVLPNWNPQNQQEVLALAPILPYPILIKPRTHVYRVRNDKGIVVHSPDALPLEYQQYAEAEQACATPNPLIPDASLPILQQFVCTAREGVHSISGFIDRTGELFVTRRATKVLQRSQPIGVGICFESLPAEPSLSESVQNLCRALGYFGIFEVEFVQFNGRWNVIDFNPRLFSQIGMDIRRGAPLPLLACLDAAAETTALRNAVALAQRENDDAKVIFHDRFTLRASLFAKTMTARISREERAYWRTWMKENTNRSVDFAADDTDLKPGVIHALSEVYLGLKAIPRFLRSTPRLSTLTRAVKEHP
jgi:predicted ATP-grasp superfamily ATP-dependent carboligase